MTNERIKKQGKVMAECTCIIIACADELNEDRDKFLQETLAKVTRIAKNGTFNLSSWK